MANARTEYGYSSRGDLLWNQATTISLATLALTYLMVKEYVDKMEGLSFFSPFSPFSAGVFLVFINHRHNNYGAQPVETLQQQGYQRLHLFSSLSAVQKHHDNMALCILIMANITQITLSHNRHDNFSTFKSELFWYAGIATFLFIAFNLFKGAEKTETPPRPALQ